MSDQCHFMNAPADGTSIRVNLYRELESETESEEKSTWESKQFNIPRSKKAQQTHLLGKGIKVVAYTIGILAPVLLPPALYDIQNVFGSLMLWGISGGLTVKLFYWSTQTKSSYSGSKRYDPVRKHRKQGYRLAAGSKTAAPPLFYFYVLYRWLF